MTGDIRRERCPRGLPMLQWLQSLKLSKRFAVAKTLKSNKILLYTALKKEMNAIYDKTVIDGQ